MRLSIFWRLLLGYLALLGLFIGFSSYSIVRLGGVSDTARIVLEIDNGMIAKGEKLADVFLSEVRYGRKFVVTQAGALHEQSLQFKKEFLYYLDELSASDVSPQVQRHIQKVRERHVRYHELFDQEVRYVRNRQPYADTRYREEKAKILDSLLKELDRLKAQLQKNVHGKLEAINSAASTTRNIAVAATLILIAVGIGICFLISRSITGPIAELSRTVTQGTAAGYELPAGFTGPPELQELAESFDDAKRTFRKAAETNSEFHTSVNIRLTTPLTGIRERLRHLNAELDQTVTEEQKLKIFILIEETDRLVHELDRLPRPDHGIIEKPSSGAERAPHGTWRSPSTRVLIRKGFDAWRDLIDRVNRKTNIRLPRLRILATSFWSVVKDSVYTLRFGKVKK